jgi:hypothetical protein
VEPAGFRRLLQSVGGSRYIQDRHTRGTVANRTSLAKNRNLRRLLGAPLLFLSLARALPLAVRHRGEPLGGAQWVHLTRG